MPFTVPTEYAVIGEGNANSLVKTPHGTYLRISKSATPASEVIKYQQKWSSDLGDFLVPVKTVTDPQFGIVNEIKFIDKIGEFKPKWLTQSEGAPPNSKCCRTCCIRLKREQQVKWCPLKLAKLDQQTIEALSRLISKPEHHTAVANALATSPLIPLLATLQATTPSIKDKMALRDVTILIDKDYKLWIIDLDPKDNLEKWAAIENSLQELYQTPPPESICMLNSL